ncbi:GTPase HflX [Leptolyngbya sp. FACHB-541]|uniref:GTPase HflX n=1 Tax=Leptolyngbya sp. FACHB-541 TaxID=2692810 RepID=UPI001683860F|nr:GTPase HflX [Leptolyngbya sp. FACHB-541]MBD1997906.1 GTPase HflX [Leptolyngbya sp. FACHB-541]
MEKVYGNTQGIRSSHLKQLQQLYEQRQPGDRFVTSEFAQQLTALSLETHHPLCSYINRRGQIVRIAIGTPAQTQLAASELPRQSAERLSGIHCVAVQPTPPDAASLLAMVRQRLDALVILIPNETDGKRPGNHNPASIKEAYLAHLVSDLKTPWAVSPPFKLEDLVEQDSIDWVDEWETEFQESGFAALQFQQIESDDDRVLLVGLMTDDLTEQRFHDGLAELTRLVETAGGEVVGTVQQKRSRPHPQTVVGQGKVEEITLQAQTLNANLIAFDRDISASQSRNLEEQIGIRVVDRTQVILDIFAQRAQSQAGKLQVELAQMEYLLPRLRGRGREMSRLGAGIGTRGPGETRLEVERRTIQQRISHLQHEVNQLQAHRSRQRQQRQQQDIPTVALVGYTNAGKSTLLNVLTQAEVYVADQLFATLDPTTRRLTISEPLSQEQRPLLLTDTVGFIHELPPALIDAFRATLEEVTEADALLHVIDLSHPAWESHIHSVEAVLADLSTLPDPNLPMSTLLVFNKLDQVDSETLAIAQQQYPQSVFISATKGLGLDTLRQRLLQLIDHATIPV